MIKAISVFFIELVEAISVFFIELVASEFGEFVCSVVR